MAQPRKGTGMGGDAPWGGLGLQSQCNHNTPPQEPEASVHPADPGLIPTLRSLPPPQGHSAFLTDLPVLHNCQYSKYSDSWSRLSKRSAGGSRVQRRGAWPGSLAALLPCRGHTLAETWSIQDAKSLKGSQNKGLPGRGRCRYLTKAKKSYQVVTFHHRKPGAGLEEAAWQAGDVTRGQAGKARRDLFVALRHFYVIPKVMGGCETCLLLQG